MIAGEASAHIWYAVAGRVLHSFQTQDPVCDAVFSQKSNQLVVLTSSGGESAITIIDNQEGIPPTPCRIQGEPSQGEVLSTLPLSHSSPTRPLDTTFALGVLPYTHRIINRLYDLPISFGITFGSEDPLSSYRDTRHILCSAVSPSKSDTPAHLTTYGWKIFSFKQKRKRQYDVDDNREWVVVGSRRTRWIPPGYIGSAQASHCWAGLSLIMAGQDKTLRKPTPREALSGDF